MGLYSTLIILVAAKTSLLGFAVNALGINCAGSGLCPLASWNDNSNLGIMQILYDAIKQSTLPNSTAFSNGQHVICVSESQPVTIRAGVDVKGVVGTFTLSGTIHEGGICVFPQNLPSSNQSLTLGQILPLAGALLEHGCTTCGSVPIHFVDMNSNDPSAGILTFNYVADPFCVGNCLSDSGTSSGAVTTQASPVGTSLLSTSTTSTVTTGFYGNNMTTVTAMNSTSTTTVVAVIAASTAAGTSSTLAAFPGSTGGNMSSVAFTPMSSTSTTAVVSIVAVIDSSTALGASSTPIASTGSIGPSSAAAASTTPVTANGALKMQGIGAAGAVFAALALL